MLNVLVSHRLESDRFRTVDILALASAIIQTSKCSCNFF